MKTLYRKYTVLPDLEADIQMINGLLGYPDGNGTDTYSHILEPIEVWGKDELDNDILLETYWLMEATHNLQENGNPDIPLVSVEILNGQFVVTQDAVQATNDNADENILALVGNIKNNIVDVIGDVRTSLSDKAVQDLIDEGNVIITVSPLGEIKDGKVGVISKEGNEKYSIEAKGNNLMIESLQESQWVIEEKDKLVLIDEKKIV